MKRGWIVILLLGLAGCTESAADFRATIEPNRGHVPFEATITATDIADSYTFYLPNETITQESPTLLVVVDAVDWTATVETSYAGKTYAYDVHATGSNAPPSIDAVVINGIRDRGLGLGVPGDALYGLHAAVRRHVPRDLRRADS
jgi:hypothetical protein